MYVVKRVHPKCTGVCTMVFRIELIRPDGRVFSAYANIDQQSSSWRKL